MDRKVLEKYKKQEDKLILSKVFDKINFCENKNQIQTTDFLDMREQDLVEKFLNLQGFKNYLLFGGYENAERKILIIYPEKFRELINENRINFNEFIKVIRVNLPNENINEYEHKNYLGGLMKLQIRREKIGDIIVSDNGADIIISKDILKFLLENLISLTRFSKSDIQEIKLEDLRKIEVKKEEFKITVSSTRLDNIVSELAKCSRNKANELLMQERIFVNYECITKQTKEIKEKDKITIRGKGRFFIKEILGNSKKGKIIILIEK